jgi:hypothetical protein
MQRIRWTFTNSTEINQILSIMRRCVVKEAALSQIIKYLEQPLLMMYWRVRMYSEVSSCEGENVQGCRQPQWRASLMVSKIGPRRWMGEQKAWATMAKLKQQRVFICKHTQLTKTGREYWIPGLHFPYLHRLMSRLVEIIT